MNQNEHHRLNKDGKAGFGIMDINTKKAYGDNVWTKVEMVVQAYAQVHPQEVKEIVLQNAQLTATRKNEYASNGKIRWGASLPVGLMMKLEQVEPKLFSDKKLFNQFMNKYKGFRVCQKV